MIESVIIHPQYLYNIAVDFPISLFQRQNLTWPPDPFAYHSRLPTLIGLLQLIIESEWSLVEELRSGDTLSAVRRVYANGLCSQRILEVVEDLAKGPEKLGSSSKAALQASRWAVEVIEGSIRQRVDELVDVVIHGDPQESVLLLGTERVDVRGIGVIEPRRQLRLAQEALELGVVAAQPAVQHLDDGLAPEDWLVAAIHLAEPAFVEWLAKNVVSNLSPEQGVGIRHRQGP